MRMQSPDLKGENNGKRKVNLFDTCMYWAPGARRMRNAERSRKRSIRPEFSPGLSGQQLSSAQITQVQQALKAKGYDPGTTDGVMGAQTQQALRKFQQANGLK